ncbi:MAG: ABC transporter permease [Candidatus Poribacteria bacterium]|nr:MAG: ABC transporter permease [Candidatus Poribacteria bacterium]
MKAYWSVFRARFTVQLQYRAAAAAGLVTQAFWGLLRVMVLEAFYRSAEAVPPLSLPEAITYTWLGQCLFRLIFLSPDPEVREMMRAGTVAYEMARPVDLYAFWLSRALADRIVPTVLRAVPMAVLATVFFGMQFPPSLGALGAWALALVGALFLSAAISVLLTVSLLWTIAGEGITRLVPAVALFLSGLYIPLPLFPEWCQPVFDLLPFRGLGDLPFRLYTGHLPPEAVFSVILRQWVWIGVFVLLGRSALRQGMRRLVVQGG